MTPTAAAIAVLVFVTTPIDSRRVQNKQEIFGLGQVFNRTQDAFETVRDHAQSGFETVAGHAQNGWETVANVSQTGFNAVADAASNTQSLASTVANRTQETVQSATEAVQGAHEKTKKAVTKIMDDLACDAKQMTYANKTLQGMCADANKQYDCVAGVFSVGRGNPKKEWVQCLEHPPMLTYGEPTCQKTESDGETTYVLACQLCLAHTKLCFHWAAWAIALIVLLLCCCCCCVGVCCATSA